MIQFTCCFRFRTPLFSPGRVIFERKTPTSDFVALGLGTLALLLPGILLIHGGVETLTFDKDTGTFLVVLGVALLVASFACILGIVHGYLAVFRCHQYGLVRCGIFGERSLKYENVDCFTYQATRHFHNGVYVGTKFRLGFTPHAEHKSQRIQYRASLRHDENELNNLREQVAMIIGERMRSDVQKGLQVVWTPALKFRGSSVIYAPISLFGRKAPLMIPLTEIASYQLDQGKCYIFREGEKKPIIQESVGAGNFFPGLYCMLKLINAEATPL